MTAKTTPEAHKSFEEGWAFVTGGARGLGECLSRALAQLGLSVHIADVRQEAAEQVAEDICKQNGQAYAHALDITDAERVNLCFEKIESDHGPMRVVITNAAIDKTVPVEELSVNEWRRILDTNLTGPFIISKMALKLMKPLRTGHIINICSTAAKRAWPNASAYHASKWGLLGLSHALHCEAKSHGIKVTALICGGMRTPFLLERFPDIDTDTLQDPKSVARVIEFLLNLPLESTVPEMMILPMTETSWP